MFSNTNITPSNKHLEDGNQLNYTFAQIIAAKSMESKLIVKNFGPIKHVDLDLRNVNVFIGPQATGKSALAKLYTILKAPRKFFYKVDADNNEIIILDHEKASNEFTQVLEEYNIKSFLKPETEIEFDSDIHTIKFSKGKIIYEPKLYNKIKELESLNSDYELNHEEIIEGLRDLADNFILFSLQAHRVLSEDAEDTSILGSAIKNVNKENCPKIFDIIKSTETYLSTNAALYIPAERNFINIIKKSSLNLLYHKVPIPTHILSFGAELEKLEVTEIDLGFIQKNLKFKVVNGEDRIFTTDNHSIMLTEAASGVQSVVPVLLSILSKKSGIVHRSLVIEEPELNLSPTAQYELVKYLESNRPDHYWGDYGNIHTYTTHSPYILSALNNLLYAYKVRESLNGKIPKDGDIDNERNVNATKVREIVQTEIKPFSFTAYQINDGHAESIFDRDAGLIMENYIDSASDKINDDFEKLMELTQ